MVWLFNALYVAGLLLGSPWLLWRWLVRGKPIAGWRAKATGSVVASEGRPRIWLHAVSVGEVNLLAILFPALRRQWPGHDFVLSTTTRTGRDVAEQKLGSAATLIWFPWDFSWAVRRVLASVQPELIILSELELWPNFLRIAKKFGVPIAVINGRLSERSARGYNRWRWWLGDAFTALHLVAAQSETYAARFRALGVPSNRVCVTGNLKFDGAEFDRDNPRTQTLAALLRRTGQETIWLAGSTQHPEEERVLAAYCGLRREFPHLRLIVAPRHPERAAQVENKIAEAGLQCLRRSRLTESNSWDGAAVLLIDTVGELAAWWGLAQLAFVGGSMGNRGGQNMIEPAAYGAALAFGPNTRNFRDVVELLLQAQAATVVADTDALEAWVRNGLRDPDAARQAGERAARVVVQQKGATAATLGHLRRLLPAAPESWRAAS